MAFPQRQSRHTVGFDTPATSHLVPMPSTVNNGDLLIIIFTVRKALGQVNTVTPPAGWQLKASPVPVSSGTETYVYARKADGTEGSTTANITTNFNRRAVANVYRITNWFGDLATGMDAINGGEPGFSSSWDPPALTAPWGTDDNLWICAAGIPGETFTVNSYPANYIDTDFDVSGASGNTGKAWQAVAVRENAVIQEDPGPFVFNHTLQNGGTVTIVVRPEGAPGDECETHEPSTETVRDEFDGPNDTPLSSHVSDSGHAWIEGHGNPPLVARRRFSGGSFSSPQLYPMVLNGQGALVNPQAWRLRDSRQLAYAPRTSSYEIGACFQRQDLAMPDNSLSFFWRDTSTEYGDSRGKRYELFLLKGGDMRLQKRIGNTVTVLDSDTEVFADGVNNYLQIIQDGSDISIKLNGDEVLSATDASILETGTISMHLNGRSLLSPYPKGFWRINWLYVDDSYASFPVANKAVVLTERLRALESLVKDEPDFETTHFVNVPDTFNCIENIENSVEEPNEKTVELLEGVNITDVVAELLREETCSSTATFKQGAFTKATTTGNQVINHALGVAPKALIIWQAGDIGASRTWLFGVSDGTSQGCIADTEVNNSANSNTDRRFTNANIITMINSSGTVIWAATLTAWDANNFTLNWGTNDSNALTFHYIIMGGGVMSAKIVEWGSGTSVANVAVTGAGFEPECLIHVHQGAAAGGLPATGTACNQSLGFVDAAGNTRAFSITSVEAQATMNTVRVQQNKAITRIGAAGAQDWQATHVSYDADGFTANVNPAPGASNAVLTLCLKGLRTAVGVFNKSTSTSVPVSQAVTGVGFLPKLLMFFSVMDTTNATVQDHARIMVGGSDGTNEGATIWKSQDNVANALVHTIDNSTKALRKANNNSTTIEAEADLSSFDSDGFTLSLTTNDAVATEIIYLAFGDPDPFECDKKIIQLLDHLFALDSPELSGDKGIELLETAHIRELPGVSGNSINKRLTIAEFMNTEDIPSSSREIGVSDSFSTTEVVGRVFAFLEAAAANDTLSIAAALGLTETVTVSDAIAAKILIALSDTMTASEILSRFADIRDSVTLQDLITLMRQTGALPDVARARDTVQVIRSGTAEFLPPEKTFFARDLKTYFVVERGKKIR